ncbi:MAG TPA: S9 family peptidase, partial [Bacteroidales bacterium]|nr:S9 family peptidase [Bacteroidales bacterium]
MNKKIICTVVTALIIAANLSAQKVFMPQKLYKFEPIAVQKPVLLDSTNLNQTKFTEDLLLSYSVSFPEQERFKTELTPDTSGFFFLPKTNNGNELQLISFYLNGDGYGKGKLVVTSPNPLELWVDDVKRATKTQVNDSLHQSGSVDAGLNGFTNNSRVIIKVLTSSENKTTPAVKIEVKPDESDSLLNYSFSNTVHRRINIKDIMEGKRVNSSTISPSGRFILLSLRETLPGGKSNNFTEIYDTKQKRTILSETTSRSRIQWMPKSDLLFYVDDSSGDRSIISLDPLTNETTVLAKGLPKESFYMAPDEKS